MVADGSIEELVLVAPEVHTCSNSMACIIIMSRRNVARQHKPAEIACNRLEMTLLEEHHDGVGASQQCPRDNQTQVAVGRVVTGQTVCVLFKDGRNLERVSIAFGIKKKTKKKRTPRQKTNSIK